MSIVTPFEGGVFSVTSAIGYRTHPITGAVCSPHYGLDIVGKSSQNITCVCDGVVGFAGNVPKSTGGATWQWGNYVRVDCPGGRSFYYCHMSKIKCRAGDRVKVGTILGVAGATGLATGVHLHLELRVGGRQCRLPANESDPANVAAFIGVPNAVGLYRAPDPIDEIIKSAGLSPVWKAAMTKFMQSHRYGYEFWRKISEATK